MREVEELRLGALIEIELGCLRGHEVEGACARVPLEAPKRLEPAVIIAHPAYPAWGIVPLAAIQPVWIRGEPRNRVHVGWFWGVGDFEVVASSAAGDRVLRPGRSLEAIGHRHHARSHCVQIC